MALGATREKVSHISEILFQQILAVFIVLILWELFKSTSYGIGSKGTWHIILCVLGVALCMAEGVQIYRKQSIVTFGHTREDKKNGHLVVMLFGFICITIGISLKISYKVDNNMAHFMTTHSRLGLSTWIISFVAILGGLLAYQARGISRISPSIIKIIHVVIGLSAYLIAIVTLVFGLEHLMGAGTNGWIALTILFLSVAVYSLIGPLTSLFNYITGK